MREYIPFHGFPQDSKPECNEITTEWYDKLLAKSPNFKADMEKIFIAVDPSISIPPDV